MTDVPQTHSRDMTTPDGTLRKLRTVQPCRCCAERPASEHGLCLHCLDLRRQWRDRRSSP